MEHPVTLSIVTHYLWLGGVQTMHIFIGVFAGERKKEDVRCLDSCLTL